LSTHKDTYSEMLRFQGRALTKDNAAKWFTANAIWIGNPIYWTLTERNYRYLLHSRWATHSKYHCNCSAFKAFIVFTSRCLLAAFSVRRSTSSWFLNCSHASATSFSLLTTIILNWPSKNWTTALPLYWVRAAVLRSERLVAEARQQFRNPQGGQCPLLKAASKQVVTEDSYWEH
jgi:hypothetical protein